MPTKISQSTTTQDLSIPNVKIWERINEVANINCRDILVAARIIRLDAVRSPSTRMTKLTAKINEEENSICFNPRTGEEAVPIFTTFVPICNSENPPLRIKCMEHNAELAEQRGKKVGEPAWNPSTTNNCNA
mmetsp:Transcript_11625/g.15150  ORF Transcript_11625/g.15150 Transcript_11625/m.15150 type:complete len:132 (-) Transcript_11625:9-404(-)